MPHHVSRRTPCARSVQMTAIALILIAVAIAPVLAQGVPREGRAQGAMARADQARAQSTVPIADEHHRLASARVKPDSAQRLALARVPGGRVTSAELEEEGGRVTYEFIVLERGEQSIAEVEVDAQTGKIGAIEYVRGKKGRARAKAERAKRAP